VAVERDQLATNDTTKEEQEYILDWEEYSKQNNVYSWLAYILYVILFIPMLIAWIIIEYRKE
jgi:hypothetical protein